MLTYPTATQTQNQDYKVAHPNTHLIWELLVCVMGPRPDLQIRRCRISMAQGNSRLSRRSPSEGPAPMVWQKLGLLIEVPSFFPYDC